MNICMKKLLIQTEHAETKPVLKKWHHGATCNICDAQNQLFLYNYRFCGACFCPFFVNNSNLLICMNVWTGFFSCWFSVRIRSELDLVHWTRMKTIWAILLVGWFWVCVRLTEGASLFSSHQLQQLLYSCWRNIAPHHDAASTMFQWGLCQGDVLLVFFKKAGKTWR